MGFLNKGVVASTRGMSNIALHRDMLTLIISATVSELDIYYASLSSLNIFFIFIMSVSHAPSQL
jgi:hypothetical protein